MSTHDDVLAGWLAYIKDRAFPGVPRMPRSKSELYLFLKEEGAHLLHWHGDRLDANSQMTNVDHDLRMQMKGQSKAIKAIGDLLRATIVRPEELQPELVDEYDDWEEEDFVDVEFEERRPRRRRIPRNRRRRARGPSGRGSGWPDT